MYGKQGDKNMAAVFILLIITCYWKYILVTLALLSIIYGLFITK